MAKKPKKWMQKAVKRMQKKGTVGAFRKKAQQHGMSTLEFAQKVLSGAIKADAETVKQANFARNAIRISRKRSK